MRCRSLNVYYKVWNLYLEMKIDGMMFFIAPQPVSNQHLYFSSQ
jgi:hypothetical protein